MATALLPNLETLDGSPETSQIDSELAPVPVPPPAYLARIATLPDSLTGLTETNPPERLHSARLDQIEHALTILASVVARLAKEAQQSKHLVRSTEHDPSLPEERRAQRELIRSLQARLIHLEERLERQPLLPEPSAVTPAVAQDIAASLTSIRNTLASLAKRRPAPPKDAA